MKLNSLVKFLFVTTFLFSAQVDINTATSISKNFFESRTGEIYNLNTVEVISDDENSLLYVFILNPTGFIIVSGNDAAMPVLGYSFENSYRQDNLPIQLEWMFDQYKDDIQQMNINNSEPTDEIRSLWRLYSENFDYEQSRAVNPLLSCNWDQGSSWNDMCPEDSNGPGGNVLVGCVAISMGQIMYYWGYPQIGSGDHAYNHWDYGYQYANFQDAFYDYSNMADNYGTEASALLLYHAGVSVNMGYGVDGSGAQVFGGNPSTYYAMRNYFLFKNTMSQIFPEDYSDEVYKALIHEDLDSNKPIIYVGYSNDGGHAWNIDGYDGDYFHCNWGWGGYQNGYFLLSALNGFNSGQGAIINIEPQSLAAPNLVMTSNNYYEVDGDGDSVVNPGETIGIDITIENFIPWENAENIVLILEPLSNNISVTNEEIFLPNLNSGSSFSNQNNPFLVNIPEDSQIGTENFALYVMAEGVSGETFYDEFSININISLNQNGFPVDTDGTVKSSPLIIDLDGNGTLEIIYGDNNGTINVLDANANQVFSNHFPFNANDQIWGAPAAADIDLDGYMDFVVCSKDKKVYAFDMFGLKWVYETEHYLMGTPAIGNLDSDPHLEIVFASYGPGSSSDNKVYVVDHEGNNSQNFPFSIGEKVKIGVALADFDSNGKDDIVVGTDDDNLYLILDNGLVADGFPFLAGDKIQSAPSILDYNNEKTIFFGSKDDMIYSVDSNGEQIFSYETDGNVYSSPTFINLDNGIGVFFGSDDGFVYGLDLNGENLPGWPVQIGNDVVGSVLFEDLNGDNEPEIIATSNSDISLKTLLGEDFDQGSIASDLQITSASIIMDLDNDGDMEITSGNGMGLVSLDIKQVSQPMNMNTSMFRFNTARTGCYVSTQSGLIGDLNQDLIFDILDVVLLINIVLENTEPTLSQEFSGDLNSDGIFNILDVVLLTNIVLGV